ncbi:6-bladed beta-propeller [Candidatus Zixiibacteriota bacterium]
MNRARGPLTASIIHTILVPLFLLAACSRDLVADEFLTRTIEDGVAVVTNHPGITIGAPVFTFEPILTLKEDSDNEESLLARASYQFSVGDNGWYYVPDLRLNDIAVFDSEGEFIRRIGRSGDGPGEFRSINIQRVTGDTLSIFDFQNQRATLMQLDGTLIEVMRATDGGFLLGFDRGPNDTYLLRNVSGNDDGDVGYSYHSATIVDSAFDTIGQFTTATVAANMLSRIEVSPGSFSTLSVDIPYAGSPMIAHSPWRGFVASDGDSPDLTWWDYQGEKSMIIRTGLEARPITAGVRSGYEERIRRSRQERAQERGTTPQPLPDYPYPATCGFFDYMTVDDEGWIWLEDVWMGTEEPDKLTTTFHVVGPDGRYWGTAELPVSRPAFGKGRLMCSVEDPETGARIPTIFRIVPAMEGVSYP